MTSMKPEHDRILLYYLKHFPDLPTIKELATHLDISEERTYLRLAELEKEGLVHPPAKKHTAGRQISSKGVDYLVKNGLVVVE